MIKTKVPVTVKEYGDRYCLMGPLSYKTAPMEVEALEPTEPGLIATLQSLRERGVKVLYGRWLIEGAPNVILFDTSSQFHKLDEWKGDLWNLAGIPTPPNDNETNESIVFGYLVAWFLGEYVTHNLDQVKILRYQIAYLGRSFNSHTSLLSRKIDARFFCRRLSLLIFTSGRLAWPSLFAVNDK